MSLVMITDARRWRDVELHGLIPGLRCLAAHGYSHPPRLAHLSRLCTRSDTLDKSSEVIPSDLLELVRAVMPGTEAAASMNLSECPEDELKRRQVSSAGEIQSERVIDLKVSLSSYSYRLEDVR